MSEKHTPGPWFVDEDQRPGMEWNRHIYGPDGLAVCFMAHSDGKDVARDESNAALIASAPDLAAEVERLQRRVEELKAALSALVRHHDEPLTVAAPIGPEGFAKLTREAWATARAALASTEGGAK